MKRLLILVSFLVLTVSLSAQNSAAIDALFDKYAGKEGFTSVFISSRMLGMFSSQENKDDDASALFSKLKSIRILTVEDSTLNDRINFYQELRKMADFSVYEDLMTVNEADNDTRFLIRTTGKTIDELLIISGGKKGNALISIKGDLDLKNLSGLSKKIGIQQLEELDKMDKKPVRK
jgi:hypothetical protein